MDFQIVKIFLNKFFNLDEQEIILKEFYNLEIINLNLLKSLESLNLSKGEGYNLPFVKKIIMSSEPKLLNRNYQHILRPYSKEVETKKIKLLQTARYMVLPFDIYR